MYHTFSVTSNFSPDLRFWRFSSYIYFLKCYSFIITVSVYVLLWVNFIYDIRFRLKFVFLFCLRLSNCFSTICWKYNPSSTRCFCFVFFVFLHLCQMSVIYTHVGCFLLISIVPLSYVTLIPPITVLITATM